MSQVPPTPSKFSKFLAKSSTNNRKSGTESAPESSLPRKSFLGRKSSRSFNAQAAATGEGQSGNGGLEPPVIIEPTPPRPATTVVESASIPSKLTGWLSHFHSSPSSPSATDLTALLTSPSHPTSLLTSPKTRAAAGLLTAARHSKTHLDRAMRYIMDSDVVIGPPGRESLWLLGKEYPSSLLSDDPGAGWPEDFWNDFTAIPWLTYRSGYPTPIKDVPLASLPSPSLCSLGTQNQVNQQPTSPITSPTSSSSPSKRLNLWSAVSGGGTAERTWSSDSGWGCMLRTGQSMLAQALLQLHLDLDHHSSQTQSPTRTQHAHPHQPLSSPSQISVPIQWTRSTLLSLFLDTPAPTSPFSVHRFAIVGKELGKEIGTWFGPSTAGGAIKKLVSLYPQCGLAVVVASDQSVYESEVFAASFSAPSQVLNTKSSKSKIPRKANLRGKDKDKNKEEKENLRWGDRPVLVLIGARLGLEGINPVYYECIKQTLRLPWTVGIAGGRPSSSYYFVGHQGDNLFYLDPHFTRGAVVPTVPGEGGMEGDADDEGGSPSPATSVPTRKDKKSHHWRSSTTSIVGSGSSAGGGGRKASGSISQQRGPGGHSHHTSNLSSSPSSNSFDSSRSSSISQPQSHQTHQSHSSYQSQHQQQAQAQAQAQSPLSSPTNQSQSTLNQPNQPILSAADLKTYTCDKVRRIPIASMDPSMLLGFLIRSKEEWVNFRASVGRMPKSIFWIADEAPSWGGDEEGDEEGEGVELGMESVSDGFEISDEEGEESLQGDGEPEGEGGDDGQDKEDEGDLLDLEDADAGVATPRRREEFVKDKEHGYGHHGHGFGREGAPSGSASSSGGRSGYTTSTTATATTATSTSTGGSVGAYESAKQPFPITPPSGTNTDPSTRFPIREDDYSSGSGSERNSGAYEDLGQGAGEGEGSNLNEGNDDDDWVDPVQMVTPSSLNEIPGKPYTARTVSSASAMQFSPTRQGAGYTPSPLGGGARHDSLQTIKQAVSPPSQSQSRQHAKSSPQSPPRSRTQPKHERERSPSETNSTMFPRTPSPASKDWVDDFGSESPSDSPSSPSRSHHSPGRKEYERERERVSTFKASASGNTLAAPVSTPSALNEREDQSKSTSSPMGNSRSHSQSHLSRANQSPLRPPYTRSTSSSQSQSQSPPQSQRNSQDDQFRFPISPALPSIDPGPGQRAKARERDRDRDREREKEKDKNDSTKRERRHSGLRVYNGDGSGSTTGPSPSQSDNYLGGNGSNVSVLRGKDGGRTTSGGVRARVIESTGPGGG